MAAPTPASHAPGRARRAAAVLVAGLCLVCCGGACVRAELRPEPPPDDGRPKKFIVMVEGHNVQVEAAGGIRRLGFLTTRHVEAVDGEAAGERAVREVRSDPELLARLRNPPSDPPRISVQRHIQVQSFSADSSPDLGYIFYEDRE